MCNYDLEIKRTSDYLEDLGWACTTFTPRQRETMPYINRIVFHKENFRVWFRQDVNSGEWTFDIEHPSYEDMGLSFEELGLFYQQFRELNRLTARVAV